MTRRTPEDRLLEHAITYCTLAEKMTEMRRQAAKDCAKQGPPNYLRCHMMQTVEEGFRYLPESEWCERCRTYKANEAAFRSAKRGMKEAIERMRTAWRSSMTRREIERAEAEKGERSNG